MLIKVEESIEIDKMERLKFDTDYGRGLSGSIASNRESAGMHNDPTVSIVVPTWNGARFIEEQLRSLTEQTFRDLEIIVIDDKSTDNTLKIVNGLMEKDNRIKVYENPKNLGLFANYLKGAALAKGEFVCVCDQDDYWRADRVEILKGLLEKGKDNMLSYSDIEVCDENLKFMRSSLGLNETRLRKGRLGELSLLKNVTTHMMIRKKVNDLLITVSESAPFAHDHLMLVLSAGLGKIVYSKEKLLKYRQHSANAIGAFYPSVISRERTLAGLTQKITYLRQPLFKDLELDLDRLEEFCGVLRGAGVFKRASFMEYYMFLRNNTTADKCLGCLECLFPKFYERLKHNRLPNG